MSVDYSKICQNYHAGKCVYTNGKYGIFQECIFEKLSEEFKGRFMRECNLGQTIEIMKKKSLEVKF